MSLLGVCVVALCSLAFTSPLSVLANPIDNEPFASRQPAPSTLKSPRKWTIVRDIIETEAACLGAVHNNCARGALPRTLATWSLLDRTGQISAVNQWVNQYAYESDAKVWGVRDYWSPLSEFVARGKGDCEDFVIAKYTLLRSLGIKAGDLRMVIVNEKARGQLHAILLVRDQDSWVMLDNMVKQPLPETADNGYEPVMQLSDSGAKYYAGVDPMRFIQPAARGKQ
jgi:predicted transglutaminase-like cysteine proteinase